MRRPPPGPPRRSGSTGAGMIAAGLQKSSLIDYPGRLSCVIFLSGCNFTCPYCHNPELARGRYPERIGEEALLGFLSQRAGFLDGVVITGGEPTLQAGLADLCSAVRQLGLAVKLDTNGSRPDVLAELIDARLIDYVAMDIKTVPARYDPPLCASHYAAPVEESIGRIMAADLPYEFRTTCVRPFVDGPAVEEIARLISGARRYILQTFRPATVLDPNFARRPDIAFDADEMHNLQQLAAPWVQTCTVR
jgi:pyruvate formate lyase activating enzyme